MTEFRECQLRDIVCFGNGKARPKAEGNIPVYGGNGILEYADQFNYDGETIIIGRVGAYCGSVFYENRPIWISDNALAAKPKGSNSTKYLYYLLKLSDLNQHAEGSSHPLITQTLLNSVEVMYCEDVIIQKAIAEVLSSLDDKIDLLTRQNNTLEDLGQAYFRRWFDDEKNVGRLGDYIQLFDNKRIPLSAMEREKKKDGKLYPYYGAATIMDYINDYIFDGEYILLGEDGTVETADGYPVLQYATGKFWCNNHAHILQAKPPYTNYSLWFCLRQCTISHIVSGAVQPKINQQNLNSLEIPVPPQNVFDKINEISGNIFSKILANSEQIYTLQKLRDTLLPKLISGEVRVKI
jgi:type I restriction enzyme S subunit